MLERSYNSKLTEPSQNFSRCPPNRSFEVWLMKLSGIEVCVHLLSVCADTCAGRGREGLWRPWALLGCSREGTQGSCTAWARDPGNKSLQQCHFLRAPQQAPPASLPGLNLQCCPNHSSWSLASVGFSCVCSCSNKSEEAAPALGVLQCPWVGSTVPWQCLAEPTRPSPHTGQF